MLLFISELSYKALLVLLIVLNFDNPTLLTTFLLELFIKLDEDDDEEKAAFGILNPITSLTTGCLFV